MATVKRLILLGGGHAHVELLRRFAEEPPVDIAVTLVSPEVNHFYSGMGPAMLGLRYAPQELRFPLRDLCGAANARFVRSAATRIDCANRRVLLSGGASLGFDALSCNVGSEIDRRNLHLSGSVLPVKPIRNLLVATRRIEHLLLRRSVVVTVVGGGAAAFEIAGNAARFLRVVASTAAPEVAAHARASSVRLLPGRRPLHQFSRRVLRFASAMVAEAGVEVGPYEYALGIEEGGITTGGSTHGGASVLLSDLTLVATGVKAPRLFSDSGLETAEGGEMVTDATLQAVGCPGVFGVGDCIQLLDRPLSKVGVYAVRQTPVLYDNLLRYLRGQELVAFRSTGAYLLLFNLGTDRGILVRGCLSLRGRLPLVLKDRIDRAFAARYTQ